MKILVCASKTPETTTKIKFTDDQSELDTKDVKYIMNPYDEWYALVRALELKEKHGGSVTILNVGPAANDATLRKGLAIGADEAVRIDAEPASALFVARQIADFAKAEKGKDMVETRLLVKINNEWNAYTYVWNDAETDAKLSKVGDVKAVNWKNEKGKAMSVNYIVPNKNQCKSCHQQNTVLKPIGTKVKNINKTLKYADGTEMNQLEKWMEVGYLEKSEYHKFTAMADWQDENAPLKDRAMAYLEANCGHCHSKGGQARTTGLYLTTDETNPSHLGFCKGPVAAGKGSGGRKVSIHPGEPEKSILLFRMQSNDPGIMMPELGRVTEHKEGVALVEEWIASLEKEDCKQQ